MMEVTATLCSHARYSPRRIEPQAWVSPCACRPEKAERSEAARRQGPSPQPCPMSGGHQSLRPTARSEETAPPGIRSRRTSAHPADLMLASAWMDYAHANRRVNGQIRRPHGRPPSHESASRLLPLGAAAPTRRPHPGSPAVHPIARTARSSRLPCRYRRRPARPSMDTVRETSAASCRPVPGTSPS